MGIKIIHERVRCEETGRTLHCAVGKCACGREVDLDSFTCSCECGRDYNMGGDLLAPREQWGEETGESLADILGPVSNDEGDF